MNHQHAHELFLKKFSCWIAVLCMTSLLPRKPINLRTEREVNVTENFQKLIHSHLLLVFEIPLFAALGWRKRKIKLKLQQVDEIFLLLKFRLNNGKCLNNERFKKKKIETNRKNASHSHSQWQMRNRWNFNRNAKYYKMQWIWENILLRNKVNIKVTIFICWNEWMCASIFSECVFCK